MFRECQKCGGKIDFNNKCLTRDYPYKRRVKGSFKTSYFCSYACMRTALREKPELYAKRRDV